MYYKRAKWERFSSSSSPFFFLQRFKMRARCRIIKTKIDALLQSNGKRTFMIKFYTIWCVRLQWKEKHRSFRRWCCYISKGNFVASQKPISHLTFYFITQFICICFACVIAASRGAKFTREWKENDEIKKKYEEIFYCEINLK